MRNNLIPTAIVDKNGKPTTVHRRSSVMPSSAGRLGALKPSLGAHKKTVIKTSKVAYSIENLGYTSPDSFLNRAGLADRTDRHLGQLGGTAKATVPDETLYGFLRVGVSVQEAALLVDLGYPDAESLNADPNIAMQLPGPLVKTYRWGGSQSDDRSIESTVDFLAEGGVPPQKISKALVNNLNDEMLRNNVLPPEQLADLFTRFAYSVSVNEDRGTGSSRLMDAIVEGRMPYSISQKQHGVDRSIASAIHDSLYLSKKRHKESMSDTLRHNLKNDPQLLLHLGQVMSKNYIRGSYQITVDVIKRYGQEAAIEYGPELLDARLSDGTALGVEGAEEAREVLSYLKSAIGDDSKDRYSSRNGNSLDGIGNSYRLYSASLGIPATTVYASDLVEMRRAGVSIEDILPYMKQGLDTTRIIAVVTGNVPKPIATGWL